MTITLSDIPAAVATYLQTQVVTAVSELVPDSGSLNPNEEGTFEVTTTNGTESDGVRLINVVYHLKVNDPDVLQLKVPAGAALLPRATIDRDDPLLTRNTFVNEMFITITFGVLEPGEVQHMTLEAKAIDEGDATITCHLHADVDQASLFKDNVNTPTGRSAVEVV